MSLTKRLVSSIAAGGLLFAGLAAPAAAHKVTVNQMHIADFGSGGINTQMWLDPEDHPGTVKITLLKKNKAGDWVKVATKKAIYQVGWGYTHTFDPVKGKTKCKAKGVFTKANHPKLKATSKVIGC